MIVEVLGREVQSLAGEWQAIVDPYETGYYDYRGRPSERGFFVAERPRDERDRVEYDFERSPRLRVPGDWSSKDPRLLLYELRLEPHGIIAHSREARRMGEIGLYEAMSTTRAVRRLRPDPIPDEVLRRVIQAACWAPTGGNRQPWRVIAVRDPAKKKRLRDLYFPRWDGYEAIARANVARMPEALRGREIRMIDAARHLAENLDRAPVVLVFCFNPAGMAITDTNLGRPSVVGGGSVYPSVQNLLLACRAEGLGCVLTTLLCQDEPEVKALLGIPEGWGTCAFVPIGYPASKGHGPLSRRPAEKVAYLDAWEAPLFEA